MVCGQRAKSCGGQRTSDGHRTYSYRAGVRAAREENEMPPVGGRSVNPGESGMQRAAWGRDWDMGGHNGLTPQEKDDAAGIH